MTPSQVILHPSVTTSGGSAAALSRRTDLYACASRRQQVGVDLLHLLSVAPLTKIPPLVEAVFGRIYSIIRLRAKKRANLKALLLSNRLALLPDYIKDLLSIAYYYDRYFVAHGDHITKTMLSEMKNENYYLLYLTVSFVLENFTEN